jgi:hypothetical protein
MGKIRFSNDTDLEVEFTYATVAQLVERRVEIPSVTVSITVGGTN